MAKWPAIDAQVDLTTAALSFLTECLDCQDQQSQDVPFIAAGAIVMSNTLHSCIVCLCGSDHFPAQFCKHLRTDDCCLSTLVVNGNVFFTGASRQKSKLQAK